MKRILILFAQALYIFMDTKAQTHRRFRSPNRKLTFHPNEKCRRCIFYQTIV